MRIDEDGFTAFATLNARPLLKAAWLLTGDWHLAQDLVQETLGRMFQTWNKRPDAAGIESPHAYAQVVLVRTFIDKRRRRSFWERPSDVVLDTPVEEDPVELRLVIATALRKLSATDRAVVVLRYVQDRSVEQVAEDLGKTPVAIRAQSKRALDRLRGHIGADQLQDLLSQ